MRIRQSAISCIEFLLNKFGIPFQHDIIELTFDISSAGSVLDCFRKTCILSGVDATTQDFKKETSILNHKFPVAIYNLKSFFILTGEINAYEYSVYDPLSSKQAMQKKELVELIGLDYISIITFSKSANNPPDLFLLQEKNIENQDLHLIIPICKSFILEYYPNCYASCLTGSYSENKSDANSDVDIIIISEYHRNVVKETIKFSKLIFDVFIYPKFDFASFVLNDIKTLNPYLLDRLAKAVVLSDSANYLHGVVKRSQVLYSAGPQRVTNSQIIYLRHSLMGALRKIKRNLSREANIVYINRIFDSIVTLNSLLNGGWIDKRLQLISSDFHTKFFSALNEFYINNSVTEIIKIIENVLEDSGSVSPNLNTSFCWPDFNSDNITIGIGDSINADFFLSQVFLPLKEQIAHNFIYFKKNNNPHYPGVSYFIVLFNFDKKVKKTILSILRLFLSSLNSKMPRLNIVYPYNLDKDARYLSHSKSTDLYYAHVCKLWLNESIGEIQKHDFVYYYSASLSVINNIDQKELISYYKLLLKTWLVELFDEKLNNSGQLVEKAKTQLSHIKQKYSDQKLLYEKTEKEVSRLIKERTPHIQLIGWIAELEKIMPATIIYNNYYFRTYNYINNLKEFNVKDSFEFYRFQKVINFFLDMLDMSNEAKCDYSYRMLKAIES
ncbi:MAG: hypothetical protein WAQ28_08930 [Bacteroidia bacterium]